LGKGAIRCSPF